MTGSPYLASFIRGRTGASPSTTGGRSHMRESRTCGSERGAPSNGRPYREKPIFRRKRAGPCFILSRRDEHGEEVEFTRFYPMIVAPTQFPADFKLPLPPARPPCLASLHRELQFQMRGAVFPANTPA